MLLPLATLTVLLTAADHWTTYLCLRAPVPGWEVSEVNPLADWLFGAVGLGPGILVDSLVSALAVAFLLSTDLVPRAAKGTYLGLVVVWTAWAVVNNLRAMSVMGLSPLGGGA